MMNISVIDLLVICLVTMLLNCMLLVFVAVWLYCYFDEKIEQLTRSNRRLLTRLDCQEDATKRLQIFNPLAEEIYPPIFDLASIAAQVSPMAEELATEEPSPYFTYLKSHKELWRLQVKGEDNSDYADYLRGVMDECYAKLNIVEQENADRESAEAWKNI
jgi:hypothetical protein